MDVTEIDQDYRYEYNEVCDVCDMTMYLMTQGGGGEYETEVFVMCGCGNWIKFVLPVN